MNSTAAQPALRLLRTAVRGPAGQGAWFVNAAADAPVTLDWFRPRFWIAQDAVVARHTGRGAAIGFEHAGRRFLLRHYLRGGLAAALSAERYLWLGEARTRPLAELKLTLRLHADAMPVPLSKLATDLHGGSVQDRGVVLTFDDGYLDNLTVALPLAVFLAPAPFVPFRGVLFDAPSFAAAACGAPMRSLWAAVMGPSRILLSCGRRAASAAAAP